MSLRRAPSMDDRDLERWVSKVERRLRSLEDRPDGRASASHELPIVLGDWTLDVNDAGDLVAISADGNETVLASP